MGPLFAALGLSVGIITHDTSFVFDASYKSGDERTARLRPVSRAEAYAADITYGTNNEFGFDYLRDNMAMHVEDRYQRGLFFAIVDEVDSILIDEARTPLIISGPLDDRSDFYNTIDTFIPELDKADYDVDEKQRAVSLTEVGMEKMEQRLKAAGQLKSDSLYDVENVSVVHHVNQALRAHKLFTRDKDYIVRNGEVVIIDEFTGRMMPGRRYSEGLHQALEAKEHQPIQPENQTLASITFQNYFRMYGKLAGKHPSLSVYKRDDMPAHFVYGTHPRTPPIIGIAEAGWTITTRQSFERRKAAGTKFQPGAHGFDPRYRELHGLFVAAGPKLRQGVVVPEFENIHLYNLMCDLLGLWPAKNDGDFAQVKTFLK